MLRCVRPGGILSISLNALELGRPYPFTLHLEQTYEIDILPHLIHSEAEMLIRAHTYQLEKQARMMGKSVRLLFTKVESNMLQLFYQILEVPQQNLLPQSKLSHVLLSCTACPYKEPVNLSVYEYKEDHECPECSSKLHAGGPLYSGPLIELSVIQRLQASLKSKYLLRYLSGVVYLDDVLQNYVYCSDSHAELPKTGNDDLPLAYPGLLTIANMSKVQTYFARALSKVHLQV